MVTEKLPHHADLRRWRVSVRVAAFGRNRNGYEEREKEGNDGQVSHDLPVLLQKKQRDHNRYGKYKNHEEPGLEMAEKIKIDNMEPGYIPEKRQRRE